ncbi:ester cyclase [Kocuria oceani]|uniref:ester cyclase n=1 Tax=Kocuria oceani TaxID=988827 RepID=UPI0040362BA3
MSDTHTSVVGPVPGAGQDRREKVDRIFHALNAHDDTAYVGFYGADAIIFTSAAPEPVRGTAGIQQEIQRWFTAMPDVMLQLEELLVDGATAATRFQLVGTHTGPMATPSGEVPPTGKRVSMPMAAFSREDDIGLIVEEHRFLDMMGFLQQLGLT